MTPKQERFVEEYLVDLNATQAAIRAGYSEKTANRQGSRLLSNADISAAIQKRASRITEKLEITQEKVASELARLGFSNMADYMTVDEQGHPHLDLSKLTREQAAAIAEVNVETYTEGSGEDSVPVKKAKVKIADKRGALVALAKLLGLESPTRVEHTGKDGAPLTFTLNIDAPDR